MAMILFNPTNEDFETQYIGETVLIKPGAKIRVDDPRGRHVLNTLGPRGLVALEYGDEGEGEEKKKQRGIERNLAFKRKQVIDFNTMNEQRFQAKQPYLTPTSKIKEYAKELGIGLREPYNVEDAAMKEMSELKKKLAEKTEEVSAKDNSINELKNQVEELTGLVNKMLDRAGGAVKKEPEEEAEDGINVDLRKFGPNNMADWLLKNWNLYQNYPEEQQEKIAKRYETIYKESFPATKEELAKKVEKLAA